MPAPDTRRLDEPARQRLSTRLFARFRQAATASGRPLAALWAEALALKLSPSHLGTSEYLNFKLYLGDLDARAKRQFVGRSSARALKDIVADERARFIVRDKLTTYTLLRGYGFPTPPLRTVYRSTRPGCIDCIEQPEALIEYLRTPGRLPLYLKPSWGSRGVHNCLLLSCDGDRLQLGDGRTVGLSDFVHGLDDGRGLAGCCRVRARTRACSS